MRVAELIERLLELHPDTLVMASKSGGYYEPIRHLHDLDVCGSSHRHFSENYRDFTKKGDLGFNGNAVMFNSYDEPIKSTCIERKFYPKTELAKKLWAIKQKAMAAGETLENWEDVLDYIKEVRCGDESKH